MRIFAGQHLSVQRDGDGAIVIRWDTPGSAINQPHEDMLAEWSIVLDRLAELPRLTLVMLGSGKKGTFGRGWSPEALQRLAATQQLSAVTEMWDSILVRLENLPCPTLVAIAGQCQDEALDLAMACDYRLAYRDSGSGLGWTSQTRGWSPPPSTLKRLVSQVGIEFCCRLLILEEQLNATMAHRWDLVSATATGEAGLRQAVEMLRKKAFLEGKPARREPSRFIPRIMNRSPFWRGWMLRGMKRVLDRLVCPEMPIGAYQWRNMERARLESDWIDGEVMGSMRQLALDPGSGWIRQTRVIARISTASGHVPNVRRIVRLGNAPWEVEAARRALANKVSVVVAAGNEEELGRRVMRLGSGNQVPAATILKLVQGRLIADLARNEALVDDAVVGDTNLLGVAWARKSLLQVADASSRSIGSVTCRSLLGAHRHGWLELPIESGGVHCWLNSLGFRVATVKSGSSSFWKVTAAWWAESLRALAEGVSPYMIENEARLFGFLKGPLSDLCDNMANLEWVTEIASETDRIVLKRWMEIAARFIRKPKEVGQLSIGWLLTRRWRNQSKLQMSPLVRSLPVSARVAGLRSRWIATVISAGLFVQEQSKESAEYLSVLEAAVGWPVFRGPPLVALADSGETVSVLGVRLVRLFGDRYSGLAEFRQSDTT